MLNYEEALKELKKLRKNKKKFTLEDLNKLTQQISIEDPLADDDATTILYEGMIDERVHSHMIIEDLALNSNVRLLDRTPTAQFLRSHSYRNAVRAAILHDRPDLKAKALNTAVHEFLYR